MIVSSLCYDPHSIYETLPRTNGYDENYMNSFKIATKWKIDSDHQGIVKFWIASTDNIVDTAYVLPDIDTNCRLSKEYVMVVNKKSRWKNYFIRDTDRRV